MQKTVRVASSCKCRCSIVMFCKRLRKKCWRSRKGHHRPPFAQEFSPSHPHQSGTTCWSGYRALSIPAACPVVPVVRCWKKTLARMLWHTVVLMINGFRCCRLETRVRASSSEREEAATQQIIQVDIYHSPHSRVRSFTRLPKVAGSVIPIKVHVAERFVPHILYIAPFSWCDICTCELLWRHKWKGLALDGVTPLPSHWCLLLVILVVMFTQVFCVSPGFGCWLICITHPVFNFNCQCKFRSALSVPQFPRYATRAWRPKALFTGIFWFLIPSRYVKTYCTTVLFVLLSKAKNDVACSKWKQAQNWMLYLNTLNDVIFYGLFLLMMSFCDVINRCFRHGFPANTLTSLLLPSLTSPVSLLWFAVCLRLSTNRNPSV